MYVGLCTCCVRVVYVALCTCCVRGVVYVVLRGVVYVVLHTHPPKTTYSFNRWWVTWLVFFTLILTIAALVSRFIHKFRSGLVGLLAVTTVLLMERTDTMLYASEIAGGVDGALGSRARVWVAGGIIGAFAAGLLMLFVGVHNEEDQSDQRMYSKSATTTTTSGPRTTVPTSTVESYPTGPREAAPVATQV